jgi:hypothetical protein
MIILYAVISLVVVALVVLALALIATERAERTAASRRSRPDDEGRGGQP